MRYGKEAFTEELFEHPGSAYRGAPFWAWNTKLDKEEALRQIDQFEKMGMGGFHMHTRVGLDTEYMGPEFLDIVKACVEKAEEKGMKACLYDEDRWPSGYAGGKVTKNPEYRSRYLVVTPFRKGTREVPEGKYDSCAPTFSNGTGNFLEAFRIWLDENGCLKSYELCGEDTKAEQGETIWYVYYEIAENSPWFNNQAYVDSLNPKAIQEFLRLTHEVYFQTVGEKFGEVIPSIFTDEPQFAHKQFLGFPEGKQDVLLPFTDDFEETYQKTYGESLLDHVPELLWELPDGKVSVIRYHYHDHVAERFASSYSDQVGKWCEEHGISLCGHMMEEPTLYSQTRALGEVMRNLRGFTMPGIDMLCDQREYSTAKQAQSVAHQYGREGCAGEIYGVTNWDFDFRRHKLQGDWLAALGITLRVPHLTWMSMGGEAKRDYPASIGFQSPWYEHYKMVEDHFARVNTVLTRGTPVVKIGVLHPVESYWLKFGPNQQTGQERAEMEEHFKEITEWLLFDLLDYDYVSESLLKDQYQDGKIGIMNYEVLIVPGMHTIRQTTLDVLEDFRKRGKQVIFLGEIPALVDAGPSKAAAETAKKCTCIPFSRNRLLTELEPYRQVDIHYDGPKFLKKPNHKKNWDGERTEKYLYQMRQWEGENWIFIANGKPLGNPDLVLSDKVKIALTGAYRVELWNTLTGEKQELESQIRKGKTELRTELNGQDSLLLRMIPDSADESTKSGERSALEEKREVCKNRHPRVILKRDEPNVLVLDKASWQIEGRDAEPEEETLRLDNEIRDILGYPRRKAAYAQPWVQKEEEIRSIPVTLTYEIFSETEISDIWLAMEGLAGVQLFLNGKPVEKKPKGYYVDPAIPKTVLGTLKQGANILRVVIPFTAKTNLEACYILGIFSVRVQGDQAVLAPWREEGWYGSLTEQGMPFYGGNAVYEETLELEKGLYEVQVSKFRAPVLEVELDGKHAGMIAFAPYTCRLKIEKSGVHTLGIRAFGSRVNTFGAIHDCDEQEVYFDPNAWRTEEDSWSYEYQLKKTGILKRPVLWKIETAGWEDREGEGLK